MEDIALLFIHSSTVWLAFFCIIVLAVYQYIKFSLKVNPLILEFDQVNKKLSDSEQSKVAFCAFYDDEFNEFMNSTKYLKDSWREFNETLLIPEKDFSIVGDDWKILNTHHTSTYFNQRYILWSKVNMRWFNALPNILTGIGIVGTFIGLVAGIYIASPGLSADSIDEAKAALNTLLSGASMAFLTSIAGLASSMFFSKAEKSKIHEFDKKCQKFVAEIDARVEYFSQERLSNKVLQESQKQSYALETFANDLAVTMGKVLEETVSAPLVTAINELTDKQKSANDETIEKVMQEFSASIAGAAGEEMKALAQTIETVSNKLEDQLLALSTSHKMMNETATQIINEMSNVADKAANNISILSSELGTAVETQKGLNESNSELYDHVKDTVFTAGNVVESIKDSLEDVTSAVDKQAGLMEATKNVATRLDSVASHIATTHNHIVEAQSYLKESLKDHRERFAEVDQALGKVFNNLNDGLSQYADSTNKYLIELDKHAAKVVGELAIASKEISSSVESLGDGLEQHKNNFISQISSATRRRKEVV